MSQSAFLGRCDIGLRHNRRLPASLGHVLEHRVAAGVPAVAQHEELALDRHADRVVNVLELIEAEVFFQVEHRDDFAVAENLDDTDAPLWAAEAAGDHQPLAIEFDEVNIADRSERLVALDEFAVEREPLGPLVLTVGDDERVVGRVERDAVVGGEPGLGLALGCWAAEARVGVDLLVEVGGEDQLALAVAVADVELAVGGEVRIGRVVVARTDARGPTEGRDRRAIELDDEDLAPVVVRQHEAAAVTVQVSRVVQAATQQATFCRDDRLLREVGGDADKPGALEAEVDLARGRLGEATVSWLDALGDLLGQLAEVGSVPEHQLTRTGRGVGVGSDRRGRRDGLGLAVGRGSGVPLVSSRPNWPDEGKPEKSGPREPVVALHGDEAEEALVVLVGRLGAHYN